MQITFEKEEEIEPRRNRVQEYIEKRKTETTDKKEKENADNEKAKQKQAERSEKLHKAVNTGLNVMQSIPHFATLAIGAGAGGLLQKMLDGLKDKK